MASPAAVFRNYLYTAIAVASGGHSIRMRGLPPYAPGKQATESQPDRTADRITAAQNSARRQIINRSTKN